MFAATVATGARRAVQFSTYGTKYQCVELVNRFVRTRDGVTTNIWGNARKSWTKPGVRLRNTQRGMGTCLSGDIIVWSGGSSGCGHVAVVSAVAPGRVTFVEQNAAELGRTLSRPMCGKLLPYGAHRAQDICTPTPMAELR